MRSEDEIIIPASTADSDLTNKRRANMAKARAARKVRPRNVVERTAEDVRAITPVIAERSEPTREVRLPDGVVTRRKREDRQVGGLDLPKQYKKAGWSYEYKTIRVLNQPVDESEIQDHREAGWRAEKARDWPTLCEPGTLPDTPIERMGQRLYGRPMSLTMEAKAEDHDYALRQQRDRMTAAASGNSAIRGEHGIGEGRAVRVVPGGLEIEGLAG